jgi:hypothetical protein
LSPESVNTELSPAGRKISGSDLLNRIRTHTSIIAVGYFGAVAMPSSPRFSQPGIIGCYIFHLLNFDGRSPRFGVCNEDW